MSFFKIFDPLLILGPFLGAISKSKKKSVRFPNAKFYAESIGKKVIEKSSFPKSSPDIENSQCRHQQPYNFFSVFADI